MRPNIYIDPYQHFPKFHHQELRGTEGMKVTLVDYPANPYQAMAMGQTASYRPWQKEFTSGEIGEMLEKMATGKVWPGQAFESINLTFAIENISRACTHQLVRIRIGAGFMQESGREGSWDKCSFITPLTILENDYEHKRFVNECLAARDSYTERIRRGIPPQDARFGMEHAIAQNMWMTINFSALLNWCGKRLCTTMQWEINTLARMVRDSVVEKFPHLGAMLKSNCHRAGHCLWSKEYRGQESAMYYQPTADNNGNKVYAELDKGLCGSAGNFSNDELKAMLFTERSSL